MVRVADKPDAGSVFPFLFGAPARFLTPESARGIELELSTLDPDLRRAFEDDLPFPEGPARVEGTALRARGGREIAFAAGEGKVRFAGEGGRFAGLGAFREPAEAVAFLGLEDGELEGELAASLAAAAPAGATLYLVLRWGYDLEASGRGALGLGAPGRFSFRGEGRREARYAVIRRLPAGTGARAAVAGAMDAWLLPRHLGPETLPPPGSWLVAETEGRLALEMGARAGWRLDWLRATRAGGLAGEVGLRLAPRFDASVALETEGRLALVVERAAAAPAASRAHEPAASGSAAGDALLVPVPDRRVRLRVHRLRRGKRRFAFDLSVSARAEPGAFGPPHLEVLLRGLLGVDAARALEDLAALERWTEPERLPGELADLGADYLRDLLSDLTGVDAADLEGWRRARQTAVRFLRLWRELEVEAAAQLLELAEEAAEGLVDLEAVRAVLRPIAEGEEWRARLREALEGSGFGRSPAGRLVEALAGGGPVELLIDDERLGALRESARRVLRILDGGSLQKVLGRVKSTLDRRLDLSGAEEALLRGDPARLDRWLRKRLEERMDEALDLEALRRVHGALESFREKREALYEASLAAVERRYRIRLAGSLQRRRMREALADATFDLARERALALYREAADGRLDLGLLRPAEGVRLHAATLTHRIERRTWIALSLPFADLRRQSLATSLARAAAIEEEDGRVLVYDVEAQDRRLRPGRRLSRLAVAGAVGAVAFGRPEPGPGATEAPGPADGGLRIAEDGGLRFTYAHRTAVRNALPTALAGALRPMAALHLPGAFADLAGVAAGDGRPGAVPDASVRASDAPPTLEAWLAEAEATLEARVREAMGGAPSLRRPEGRADLWVELEVALPLRVGAGWLRAPGEERDPRYRAMSRRLQARLKELALFHFFADPERYRELDRAAVILAYASLPPTGSLEVRKGRLVESDREIHWDWPSRGLRRAVLFSGATELRLRAHLQRIYDALRRTPGLKDLAAHYEPRDLERIRVRAFALDEPLLESFLFVEAQTVKAARAAGLRMARFREEAGIRPAEALEALADFGAMVTRAFHRKAPPWVGGSALRIVAPLAIAEAADALAGVDAPAGTDPPAETAVPAGAPHPGSAASLTLHAVPPDAGVKPGRFLGQGRPPPRRVRWLSRTVVWEG